jgi:hypothetical protein
MTLSATNRRPRRTAPAARRKDHARSFEWFLNALLAAVLFAPLGISLYRLLH